MRSSFGAWNNSSGGPCSRMRPECRKHTRSEISRAKAISCVAISIVAPSRAKTILAMNHKKKPLDDVRVRKAIAYAGIVLAPMAAAISVPVTGASNWRTEPSGRVMAGIVKGPLMVGGFYGVARGVKASVWGWTRVSP